MNRYFFLLKHIRSIHAPEEAAREEEHVSNEILGVGSSFPKATCWRKGKQQDGWERDELKH